MSLLNKRVKIIKESSTWFNNEGTITDDDGKETLPIEVCFYGRPTCRFQYQDVEEIPYRTDPGTNIEVTKGNLEETHPCTKCGIPLKVWETHECAKINTVNGIKIEGGEDRQFSTGAKRQAAFGKGTPVLLPPDALMEIAKHLEAAAAKYGDRNWEKGLPLSEILNSLLRHIFSEISGDTTENHPRAIGCNTLFYIATKLRIEQGLLPAELNDLPKYDKVK